MNANGPAIWGGCVTRREHRARSGYFSHEAVTVQGGYGALFASHGTKFNEHYACRGTRLIGATNLSPVTKLVAGTGAVSRYKLSQSQKFVTVQKFGCVQMRALPNVAQRSWVSGCIYYYKAVLGAGARAKTVTSLLPQAPTVLVAGNFYPHIFFSDSD